MALPDELGPTVLKQLLERELSGGAVDVFLNRNTQRGRFPLLIRGRSGALFRPS